MHCMIEVVVFPDHSSRITRGVCASRQPQGMPHRSRLHAELAWSPQPLTAASAQLLMMRGSYECEVGMGCAMDQSINTGFQA